MSRYVVLVTVVAAAAWGAMGDVIASFPIPAGVGCYGMAWDGQYLWMCGSPYRYFWQFTTAGTIISSFAMTPITYTYNYGAAYDGEYLWAYESQPNSPSGCSRFTTTGSNVPGFTLWYESMAGLTYGAGYLWQGFRKITTTGSIVATFWPPFLMYDLAWDGHYLWAGDRSEEYVKRFTTTGSVVGSFYSATGVANGMTFDGNYLWYVSGPPPSQSGPWAYQVDIEVVGVEPASLGKVKGLYR